MSRSSLLFTDGEFGTTVACPECGNVIGAIEFTYTVTNSVTGLPIEGVECWFSTTSNGSDVVWYGVTDAFGIVRDGNGGKPFLDAGVYHIFRQKAGWVFINPDQETVSA